MEALHDLRGDTFQSEPIQYEAFYNTTGSVAGATVLQDIAEVFQQRAREIDASGELGNRWEFFWESMSGDRTFTQRIISLYPSAGLLFEQLYTDITSKIVAGLSYLLSNPPTEANYATHNIRLNALALQRQKLMLVAHSQGNLFVNHAYDLIVPKIGAGSVKVAHVAPASPTLRGEYVLATIDLVINGLRSQGLTSVPAINISIEELPASTSDLSGHTLVGTYLDASRGGRARVNSIINTAMQALTTPVASITTGNVGAFTVTLTWDGSGDVDLHTFEPNGAHSYYGDRAGIVGYLDVDNTTASGPEHYYASCDSAVLQSGTYRVGINNYYGATGRIATVQISTSNGGTILTKTLGVGAQLGSGGNANPLSVMNVIVAKNPTTGAFSFTAN
ncbi:MAG: hypothetical protein ACOH2K_18045 [Burkholderiaceae bacterium]